MNYLKPTFLLILVFTAQIVFGQTKRVFINATFNKGRILHTTGGLHGPQAGFGWQNIRGNWHELELSAISYESEITDYGNNLINADLGLRYQYSIFIAKKKLTGRVKPVIGLGLYNYTYRITNRPLTPNMYKTRYTDIGFAGYISPGVQYTTKKNLFINLSVPMDIATINFSANRVYNPTWTTREQRNSQFEFNTDPLSDIYLRAGFGLLF